MSVGGVVNVMVFFFFGNREATFLRLVVRTVHDHPYLSKASRTFPLLC